MWLQREMIRRHRLDDDESMELRSEVWRAARTRLDWPVETVAWALDAARKVVSTRPFNSTYLLGLPYAATRELPVERRAELADRWTWFADRADLLGYLWPGPLPDLALIIQRLLPAGPGSPDPHHVFSDRCPLAARLRPELPLTEPAIAELFGLCERISERPPADHPAFLAQARPLLANGGGQVLRKAVLVALAHVPVDTTVWVRGRQERQRIWCRHSTQRVLDAVLLALSEVPEPWVDPLLGAIGTREVLAHPARRGRRPPLLRSAMQALLRRKTEAATGELGRMYSAYPDELDHWRWVIEKRLRR
ncbi:hypothetical protein GCM10027569_62380 [Flindersiella endophytica]